MRRAITWSSALVFALAPMGASAEETAKVPETRNQMLLIPVGMPPINLDAEQQKKAQGKTKTEPLEFLYYGFSEATRKALEATAGEDKVKKACTPIALPKDEADYEYLALGPIAGAAVVAVATWAAGKAIDWVVAKIDARLKAEVEKYNHAYSAVLETAAYHEDEGDDPILTFTCLRITRIVENQQKVKDIAFDLVVQVTPVGASGRPSADMIGLKWRAIRLFVNNRSTTPPLAKFDDKTKTITYAAKLVANSTWRGEVEGGQGQVFSLDLGSWSAELKSEGLTYKLLIDDAKAIQTRPGLDDGIKTVSAWDNWSGALLTPIIPMSYPRAFPNGHVVFSATMAESTAVPRLLKKMQEAFDKNKDTVASELKSVVKQRIKDTIGN